MTTRTFHHGFICLNCRGPLAVIDTRQSYVKEEDRKAVRKDAQQRLRKYCCINCGRRCGSLEILNPQYYAIKDLPKSTIRQKFGER